MLPSRKQFFKWTLPSKASYISLIVGVIAVVLAIAFWLWPRSTPSPTDEFVIRNNPIKIELMQVKIMRWMGDDQDSITAILKNSSSTPVDRVRFSLGDEIGDVPTFQSKATKKFGNTISVPSNSEAQLPVAGVGSLETILARQVCDVSIEANANPTKCPAASANSYLLTLRLDFETIFKEKRHDEFKFWIHTTPAS